MPFTLSHAILAPPLAKLSGGHLPIAALAIGCMVPDLFRLFTDKQSATTHLWTSLIYPDLWIGLAFCLLWYCIYRPVIYHFLSLQDPLPVHGSWLKTLWFLIMICMAVIIGTITHLIWDGLTHVDFRTFAFKQFLSQPVELFNQRYYMHSVLQIGSSIVTLPFLYWMSAHYIKKYRQPDRTSTASLRPFFFTLLFLAVLGGMISVIDYQQHLSKSIIQFDLYYFTGRFINIFMQSWLMIFTIGCTVFLFFMPSHRNN